MPVNEGQIGACIINVEESTEVRIIRQQSVRVAPDGDNVYVYHNLDNPK